MQADPMTVSNGTTNQSYAKTQQSGNSSVWSNSLSVAGDEQLLRIQHTGNVRVSATNKLLLGKRRYFAFERKQTNANGIDLEKASASVAITVPDSGTFTKAEIETLVCSIANFLGASLTDPGAIWDKLYNGES